jgi:predicted nucleotidyltransferase
MRLASRLLALGMRSKRMNYHRVNVSPHKIAEFCRRHGIRKLALFGSVLRDDFKEDSDIDVLVEFEPGAKVGLNFFSIERELSLLLERKVDLNTPGFLGKYVHDQIMNEAVVQYESA